MSKACQGNFRVGQFKGCGTEVNSKRTYGLCSKCLFQWTQVTLEGSEWFKKQTAYKMKQNQNKAKKEDRNKTREMKIHLMSNTKYWSSELQPTINKIARLIDVNCPCIASGRFSGKRSGGHYFWIVY